MRIMVTVSRLAHSLTDDTILKLIDTSIDKHNQKQKLTRDLDSTDLIKEMNNNMRIIKEQNDEIIGDKFE